jgi:hypothetical protein
VVLTKLKGGKSVQDEKVTPPFSTTLNPAKTETDVEL